MRRLLVLGTAEALVRLVKLSKAAGIYTVVCDGNPSGPARAFADRDYVVDVRDVEAIARICRKEKIDNIITSFSDIMFECMVRIADLAGLPCYIRKDQLPAYREKQVIRSLCEELEIGVPRFVTLSEGELSGHVSAGGDRGIPQDFPFPAVIKPADSYGSRGLKVVWNRDEALEAVSSAAAYAMNGKVLLEEYSRGQELNCMACVADGVVYMISAADRMTKPLDKHHIPVDYENIYPSRDIEKVLPMVREILQTYVNETGQKWGPVCTQCFYDGQRIEVCEITGRFFGFEHELVTYSSGFDIEQMLLDLTYDREKLVSSLKAHDPKGSRYAAVVYLQSVREGVVADQSSLEKMRTYPGVESVILFYEVGEEVCIFGPRPYFARFYVTADTREELDTRTRRIMKDASVKSTDGEEILFDIADC